MQTIRAIADIVGDNAKHALYATPLLARAVFISSSGTTGSSLGDSNVAAAAGVHIPTAGNGGPLVLAPDPINPANPYDLSQIFVYAISGGTVQVSYIPAS
jgi:hypothetical protein